jgi:DNA-binding transcriptional MerR regulator
MPSEEALVEIGSVAREIGVTPSTLRSWERRYRVIEPHRGAHGERLYDSGQVELLRRIQTQIRLGARTAAAHAAATSAPERQSIRVELPPGSEAPRLARLAVDAILAATPEQRFAFFARLVAVELVSNAVVHGRPAQPIALEIRLDPGTAQLRVHNTGRALSLKELRTRRAAPGWGLEIVDALAASWTIESGPLGTTVTVCLPSTDAGFADGDSGTPRPETV